MGWVLGLWNGGEWDWGASLGWGTHLSPGSSGHLQRLRQAGHRGPPRHHLVARASLSPPPPPVSGLRELWLEKGCWSARPLNRKRTHARVEEDQRKSTVQKKSREQFLLEMNFDPSLSWQSVPNHFVCLCHFGSRQGGGEWKKKVQPPRGWSVQKAVGHESFIRLEGKGCGCLDPPTPGSGFPPAPAKP